METKRFIGNDMRRLYERVRNEFGPDAIIVRTRSLLREGADPLIELVAAPPPAEPELALDLQWKMVDGALGRLQIARPQATIGDLEDLAAREAPTVPELAPPSGPGWEQPWDADAEEEFASANAAPGFGGFDEPRPRHFGGLEEIPDQTPPPAEWARRPRPARPAPGRREPADAPAAWAPTTGGPLRETLLGAGLSAIAADRVLGLAPGETDAHRALVTALASLEVRFPDELETALVTIQGPPGSGRTTALMRMALDCADSEREAVLVSADTTRAASREQIYAYADATGLAALDASDHTRLASLFARAHRGACLFADVPAGRFTPAGIAPDRHFSYLALPAHWRPEVLERELRGYALGSFAGCVITGCDLATDLSPVLSLAVEAGLGIAFLSSGRDISSGIEAADPAVLASGILPETTGDTTDGHLLATA